MELNNARKTMIDARTQVHQPRPFQRPDRSLKADWLDERSTSNGAVRERVEPARLGGRWFGADRQWRSKPNPPGRWRGDGRPPLQTALPDGDAITLAQGSTMLSQGPTGSAPGTASVYKMRLRADPYRSQITGWPSSWPYDQVVTEWWILRPRAMQAVS